jgi:hypothetical protein
MIDEMSRQLIENLRAINFELMISSLKGYIVHHVVNQIFVNLIDEMAS